MSMLSLFVLFTAFFVPMITASRHHGLHARGHLEVRQNGVVASPLNPTPTTLVGKVGIPVHQTSVTSSSSSAAGQVGIPVHQTPSSSISPIVGTPQPASPTPTSSGIKGVPIYQPRRIPNYAIVLIIVFGGLLVTLGIWTAYRAYKMHKLSTKTGNEEDEEDAIEQYKKYWKNKRDSGGNTTAGKEMVEGKKVEEEKKESV